MRFKDKKFFSLDTEYAEVTGSHLATFERIG